MVDQLHNQFGLTLWQLQTNEVTLETVLTQCLPLGIAPLSGLCGLEIVNTLSKFPTTQTSTEVCAVGVQLHNMQGYGKRLSAAPR